MQSLVLMKIMINLMRKLNQKMIMRKIKMTKHK